MQKVPFGKLGFDVSRLGFGMMRLPVMTDEGGQQVIDRKQAIRMVRHAIDHGVNYVDTAYGYHDGNSEVVTGLALKDGYREQVKLTTKLPQWLVKEHADMDRLLDEQLKKLDQPYVDFYLLHALNLDAFHRLQALDYKAFLRRALGDGRIKHVGFSFHDNKDAFLEIVDDYDWAMAQIQFNYLDDDSQATLEGLRYAGRRGISVVCMEPLRGGSLASPPEDIRSMMAKNARARTPVEWAFHYTGDFAEIVTILSGMSSFSQVEDNLRIFEQVLPLSLSAQDHAFIKDLKTAYQARIGVGCTACNYCQPCPQGVQIPRIFTAYNEAYKLDNMPHLSWEYARMVKERADAGLCVACGECEAVCPQGLAIIDLLQMVREKA